MSQFLTLEDVEDYVAWLPDDTLLTLAAGPHETEDGSESQHAPGKTETCRVCEAIDALMHHQPPRHVEERARELYGWHQVRLRDLKGYADRAHPEDAYTELIRDTGPRALRVWSELMGALSYARCAVIYTAARVQLANRRGQIAA